MAQYTPGSFIHYRPSGSRQPMWPAIICTDDVAPANFLRTRPPGYVTLVLRVGESLEFCWALSTEMSEYDPFVPFGEEDTVDRTPGLSEAYAVANSALEANLGLDHWRDQVRNSITICLSDDDDDDDDREFVSEEEEDFDQDLRTALRLSRRERNRKQTQNYPTPSLSPFKKTKEQNITRASESNHEDARKSFRPSPSRKRSYSPEHLIPPRHRSHLCTPPSSFSDNNVSSPQNLKTNFECLESRTCHPVEQANRSSKFTLNSGSDNLLNWGSLGKPSAVPTSDVVEGHLAASKDFVLVRVGVGREERLLHKKSVWSRSYFLNIMNGLNYFVLNDDDVWELKHPGLAHIEPEDFDYVAEYLESGSFGYIHPQGEEETNEAFVQITSASGTADTLGMTDLMEHIVDKLERLAPWDIWNILCFASRVYALPGPHLPAQERLKDMLATELARNYWVYIENEHLSTEFIQRLKDLPELERDIIARRFVALNARVNEEEEDDEDEDGGEDDFENDNFDLYAD